jgi:predicted acetyltransferase
MIIRKARPEDKQQIREIAAMSFDFALRPEPADAKQEEETYFRWVDVTDDDNTVMGSITVNDYQVYFDGNVCRMGGIGGVSTLPQYRRKGGIRKCFDAALVDMYDSGYTFSYLYPFSTAYYRRFGYESCIEKNFMTVKLNTLNPDAVSGEFRLNHARAPLASDIRSIDRRWEQQFNMMVQHDESHYNWAVEDDPAARMEYTYVYYAADGTPKAYTSFRPERSNDIRDLNCTRFCFTDREGFHGLLQVFKTMAADHRAVKFILPVVPGMQHLLSELALESVDCVSKTIGMVRVTNVKNALKSAKYRGSGQICLTINDSQIPANNATYCVCFENGRAVSVDECAEPADAVLDISAFSALLLGAADFDVAENCFTGIRVLNENACLDQVFYHKRMMIADFF